MVTPYLAAQVVIFQDDFADGIIDPANWATVDGAGQVREEDGYLKLIYRGGSPPHQQIRTAPDLLRDNVTITLNVKPAYVRSDKNAGLWVGDANAAAPTGYTCFWSQKWRRVSVSKFYLGESNGDLEYRIVKEYGGDPAYFDDHEFVVQVSPDAVSFYLDGELMGVDYATTRRPDHLYVSPGRQWMESRYGEFTEIWLNDIVATVPEVRGPGDTVLDGLAVQVSVPLNEFVVFEGFVFIDRVLSRVTGSGRLTLRSSDGSPSPATVEPHDVHFTVDFLDLSIDAITLVPGGAELEGVVQFRTTLRSQRASAG
jgi:hypothetical protein